MKSTCHWCSKSGVAVAKLLHRHGYDVTITDMSKIEAKEELEALGMSVWENGHPDTLKMKNGRL